MEEAMEREEGRKGEIERNDSREEIGLREGGMGKKDTVEGGEKE